MVRPAMNFTFFYKKFDIGKHTMKLLSLYYFANNKMVNIDDEDDTTHTNAQQIKLLVSCTSTCKFICCQSIASKSGH